MKEKSAQKLKLAAFGLVTYHFLIVVLHSVAHEILNVKATAAQLAFIVPVIIVAPVVAGFLIPKFEKPSAVLLTISMTGSFLFGLYYHFVADTIDHIAHVSQLRPEFWATMFTLTAYLLLVSEALGVLVGFLILKQLQSFKSYAARTSF